MKFLIFIWVAILTNCTDIEERGLGTVTFYSAVQGANVELYFNNQEIETLVFAKYVPECGQVQYFTRSLLNGRYYYRVRNTAQGQNWSDYYYFDIEMGECKLIPIK